MRKPAWTNCLFFLVPMALFVLWVLLPLSAEDSLLPKPLELGARMPDFHLPCTQNETHTMEDFRDKIVVLIFTSTSCPCSRLYVERLNELETTYYLKGVEIVAINSNDKETLEEAKAFVTKHGIAYSFMRDDQAVFARRMGATRTPEVFLLDRDGRLRYHGRIDDSLNSRSVRRQDLKIALEEILAGRPVSKPKAKAFGCAITQELPHTYTPD